jgi:hypothetical protein
MTRYRLECLVEASKLQEIVGVLAGKTQQLKITENGIIPPAATRQKINQDGKTPQQLVLEILSTGPVRLQEVEELLTTNGWQPQSATSLLARLIKKKKIVKGMHQKYQLSTDVRGAKQ